MAPAAVPAPADGLSVGHLEGQSAQQLANGNLEHSQAQASKKLSASEKRRQRRKESKKRAVFEYVAFAFAAKSTTSFAYRLLKCCFFFPGEVLPLRQQLQKPHR